MEMQESGEAITFMAVSEKASVSREYLYQNFKQIISSLRANTQLKTIQVNNEEVPLRTAQRYATIEAALRNKAARLEEELSALRKQKTILERRYEKALGEAEEWRLRHKQAVSELLELKSRLRNSE